MREVSSTMSSALNALAAALQTPRREGASLGSWRWTVRQRMATVRDALMEETSDRDDGWLAARGGSAFGERNVLLGRLGELGARVLEEPDVAAVRIEVARLVADVERHVQHVSELTQDDVGMELGGSE